MTRPADSDERARLSPAERLIAQAAEDNPVRHRPLSRRARQRERSLEGHMAAAVLPRHIERLREIEDLLAVHSLRLEQALAALRRRCGADTGELRRRWRETAERWSFDDVNELIRQHNDYFPIEARLPLDPRTGDYVRMRGRSYRREPIGPAWVLERYRA